MLLYPEYDGTDGCRLPFRSIVHCLLSQKANQNENPVGLDDITFRRCWFDDIPFNERDIKGKGDSDLSDVLDYYREQIFMAVGDLRNEEPDRAVPDEALLVFKKTDDQIALPSSFIDTCGTVESRENPQNVPDPMEDRLRYCSYPSRIILSLKSPHIAISAFAIPKYLR